MDLSSHLRFQQFVTGAGCCPVDSQRLQEVGGDLERFFQECTHNVKKKKKHDTMFLLKFPRLKNPFHQSQTFPETCTWSFFLPRILVSGADKDSGGFTCYF